MSFVHSQDSVGPSGMGHRSSEETQLGEEAACRTDCHYPRAVGVAECFPAVTWPNVSFRQFSLTAKIRSGVTGRRKLCWLNTSFDPDLEMHFWGTTQHLRKHCANISYCS